MTIGSKHKYDRFYIALSVPYKKNSTEIDYEEYRRVAEHFAQEKYTSRGFSYIVNPEAGEVFGLTPEERKKLMEIGRAAMPREVPVFAGVTGTSLPEAVGIAQTAKEVGIDGLFVCPPLGSMDITTACDLSVYPEIWLDWILAIDEAVDMPIILHPATMDTPEWGAGVPLDVIKETVRLCKNVVGWKGICKDDKIYEYAAYFRELEKETGRHVGILGAAAYTFAGLAERDYLDGAVSCYLNFSADKVIEMFDALEESLEKGNAVLNSGLGELFYYVTLGENIPGRGAVRLHTNFKVAAWLCGLISSPYCRPPMTKPRKIEVTKLAALMKKAGIPVIEQEKIDEVLQELKR